MKIVKNILRIVASNLTTVFSGVIVGFLLPKIISVSDYGFYKTFTLYFNYLGVLSLGIIDGIVLRFGEKDYQGLNKEKFRSYFAWYFVLHAAFTILFAVAALVFFESDYKFIVLCLGINLIPLNGIGYFQQISQITQRFKEYSIRRYVQSFANIALVLLMFVIYKGWGSELSYKFYLVGLMLINVMLFLWYVITYKELIFGHTRGLKASLPEVLSLARLGFPLLLANMCSTLLLSLDRQFVSVLFGIEEYATYAFAYSILSLITVATSAVALVIYPTFKRTDKDSLIRSYKNINSILLVCMFLTMLVYFPLHYIVSWFLPQYTYSILIFRIILPGLAITSLITVVIHNYYKILDKSTAFFYKSIVALIVSTVLNIVAYAVFKTREAISVASIVSMLIWCLDAQLGLRKICGTDFKALGYIVVMCAAFYASTEIPQVWLGMIVYTVGYALITVATYRKSLYELKSFFKRDN